MAHVSYPSSFPLECITDLITIVRNGELVTHRAEVGLHGWNIAGFALSMILGNPEGPFTALAPNEEAELAGKVGELYAAFPDATQYDAANFGAGKVNWKALLEFALKYLLPLILEKEQA